MRVALLLLATLVILVGTPGIAVAQTAATAGARPGGAAAQQLLTQYELWTLWSMESRYRPPTPEQLDQYFTNGAEATAVPSSGPGAAYFTSGAELFAVPTAASSWGLPTMPAPADSGALPPREPAPPPSSSGEGSSVAAPPQPSATTATMATPSFVPASPSVGPPVASSSEAATVDAGALAQGAAPVGPLTTPASPNGVTWTAGPAPGTPASPPAVEPPPQETRSVSPAPKSLTNALAFVAWCTMGAGLLALAAAVAVWAMRRARVRTNKKRYA